MRFLLALLFVAMPARAWTLLSSDLIGWPAPKLEVYVNPEGCSIDEVTLYARIDEALEAWNRTPYSALQVARASIVSGEGVAQYLGGSATLLPVILCDPEFGSHHNADPEGVPATTRVSTANSQIHYAGIFLNAQAGTQASLAHLTETELKITIAHEMGHALGLGHSSDEEALMYYSISGKEQLLLSQDDMDGLSYLYPRNELGREAFGVSCQAVHHAGRRPWTLVWALLYLVGTLGMGRALVRRHT